MAFYLINVQGLNPYVYVLHTLLHMQTMDWRAIHSYGDGGKRLVPVSEVIFFSGDCLIFVAVLLFVINPTSRLKALSSNQSRDKVTWCLVRQFK